MLTLLESLDSVQEYYLSAGTELPYRLEATFNIDNATYMVSIVKTNGQGMYQIKLGRIGGKKLYLWKFTKRTHVRPVLATVFNVVSESIPLIQQHCSGIALAIPSKNMKRYDRFMNIVIRKNKFLRSRFQLVDVDHTKSSGWQHLMLLKKGKKPADVFKGNDFKEYDLKNSQVGDDLLDHLKPIKKYPATKDTSPHEDYKFKEFDVDNKVGTDLIDKAITANVITIDKEDKEAEVQKIYKDAEKEYLKAEKKKDKYTEILNKKSEDPHFLHFKQEISKDVMEVADLQNAVLDKKEAYNLRSTSRLTKLLTYALLGYYHDHRKTYRDKKDWLNYFFNEDESTRVENFLYAMRSFDKWRDKPVGDMITKAFHSIIKSELELYGIYTGDSKNHAATYHYKMGLVTYLEPYKIMSEVYDKVKKISEKINPNWYGDAETYKGDQIVFPAKPNLKFIKHEVYKGGERVFERRKEGFSDEILDKNLNPKQKNFFTNLDDNFEPLYGTYNSDDVQDYLIKKYPINRTSDMRYAWKNYTESGYKFINRGIRNLERSWPDTAKLDKNELRKHFKHLDSMWDTFDNMKPLEEDIVVWRNINLPTSSPWSLDEGTAHNIHKELVDPAPQSCTINPTTFLGDGNTRLCILIPKGSKVVPILNKSEHPTEGEVTLPPFSVLWPTEVRLVAKGGGTHRQYIKCIYSGTAYKSFRTEVDSWLYGDADHTKPQAEEYHTKMMSFKEFIMENRKNKKDKIDDEKNKRGARHTDFSTEKDMARIRKKIRSGKLIVKKS